MKTYTTGILLIAEERARQVVKEGFTFEHDDGHIHGELAMAAACYAAPDNIYVESVNSFNAGGMQFIDAWPLESHWDKRHKHDPLRQLVIAGALIAAEIERLQRQPT